MEMTTVGLDLAKHVFEVHAVDAEGHVVMRKTLRRAPMMPLFRKLSRCLIGIVACGTSHYWARELIALGHDIRLMPPAYVKPYVKRGKTDAADAEAICEAVTRPMMRFVAVKSRDQQAIMSLHRTRSLLVKQRTQSINMMRVILAEFGINIPEGLERTFLHPTKTPKLKIVLENARAIHRGHSNQWKISWASLRRLCLGYLYRK